MHLDDRPISSPPSPHGASPLAGEARAAEAPARPRAVIHRRPGDRHGLIRRLISPQDLGERLKPFVFLDHLEGKAPRGMGFGFHPHSGIATLTYQLDADVDYEDTAGQRGILRAGGLEWMQAGGGTWHQGHILPHGDEVTGFQLWLALPKGVEDGAPVGVYVRPEDVPQVGNVRVLLGEHRGARSPIATPASVHYLDVALGAGERFTYEPPAGHEVAWAYVYRGDIDVNGAPAARELLVFEEGSGPLVFTAGAPARVLLGSAAKHPHRLVLGPSSVHTSEDALARGAARIQEVGRELRRAGRI